MKVSLTVEEADYMFDHEAEVNPQLGLIIQAAKAEDYGLMAEHIAILNAFSFRLGTQFQAEQIALYGL